MPATNSTPSPSVKEGVRNYMSSIEGFLFLLLDRIYPSLVDLNITDGKVVDEKRIYSRLNDLMEIAISEMEQHNDEDSYWRSVTQKFLGDPDVDENSKMLATGIVQYVMIGRTAGKVLAIASGEEPDPVGNLLACNATIFIFKIDKFPSIFGKINTSGVDLDKMLQPTLEEKNRLLKQQHLDLQSK
ncbi:hypothetical protein QQX98_007626 [Neonectria punicea]|uniref:Uncharacterized protein n=1 Tax=Neonectria punicea TaxID=979145 RepID=A0ABR1GXR3_9HYPO